MVKVGDQLYFTANSSDRLGLTCGKSDVCCVEITSVGRKYCRLVFFEQPKRLVDSDYRYNLTNKTLEHYWGANEWRFLADEFYPSRLDALEAIEKECIINGIKSMSRFNSWEKVPLSLLRDLAPHVREEFSDKFKECLVLVQSKMEKHKAVSLDSDSSIPPS